MRKKLENKLNAGDKHKNKNKRSINDMNRLVIKYPAKKISHRDGGGGERENLLRMLYRKTYVNQTN